MKYPDISELCRTAYQNKLLYQIENFFPNESGFDSLREIISIDVKDVVYTHPAWDDWARLIPGINPACMGTILGNLKLWPDVDGDGHPKLTPWCDTIEKLLSHCGLTVSFDRHGLPRAKYLKRDAPDIADYTLRRVIYEQVSAVIDFDGGYRKYYYSEYSRLRELCVKAGITIIQGGDEKGAWETPGTIWTQHLHHMALRSLAGFFMSHVLEVTREKVGLDVVEEGMKYRKLGPMEMINV